MQINTKKVFKTRKLHKRKIENKKPYKRKISMSILCGSFKNQKEDDFEVLWPSPLPSPSRKAKSHMFCCTRNKDYDNNPYSNRGLDKFEALLADLDGKKRKIFTQKGSECISIVRFVYSNSNDVKPIVVKLKSPRPHLDHKDHHKKNNIRDIKSLSLPKLQDPHQNQEPIRDVINGITMESEEAQDTKSLVSKVTKKIRVNQYWKVNLKRKLDEWWMPSYNLPLFVILVMVFLTIFGRTLAIVCTSIVWYLIPTIDRKTLGNTIGRPKKMLKSQHSRKPSENKVLSSSKSLLSSPKSGPSSPRPYFSGPINVKQTDKMKKLMSF